VIFKGHRGNGREEYRTGNHVTDFCFGHEKIQLIFKMDAKKH
jgi:hypothetical protein